MRCLFAPLPSAAPFGAFPFAALRRAPEPDATVALFARDVARVVDDFFRSTFAGAAVRGGFGATRFAFAGFAPRGADDGLATTRFGVAFFFAAPDRALAFGAPERTPFDSATVGFAGAAAVFGLVGGPTRVR